MTEEVAKLAAQAPDLKAEVERLTLRNATLVEWLSKSNADLRACLEAAETREKTLAQWPTVFRDHFGPEGGDLMIADKGVQDLVAELSMVQSDKETAEGERDALREALRREGHAAQGQCFAESSLAQRGGCLGCAVLAPKEATK
jgi:hypothetical protein